MEKTEKKKLDIAHDINTVFHLGNSDRYVTKPVILTNINNFKHNRRT